MPSSLLHFIQQVTVPADCERILLDIIFKISQLLMSSHLLWFPRRTPLWWGLILPFLPRKDAAFPSQALEENHPLFALLSLTLLSLPIPSSHTQLILGSPSRVHLSRNPEISSSLSTIHSPIHGVLHCASRVHTGSACYLLNFPKISSSMAPIVMRFDISFSSSFPPNEQFLKQDKDVCLPYINVDSWGRVQWLPRHQGLRPPLSCRSAMQNVRLLTRSSRCLIYIGHLSLNFSHRK